MSNQTENRVKEIVFSKKVKAGKKRTYFFDVESTKNNDYCLRITESNKLFENNQYVRKSITVYKEDINKFSVALNDTIAYFKTELLPDFDFEAYDYAPRTDNDQQNQTTSSQNTEHNDFGTLSEEDKW